MKKLLFAFLFLTSTFSMAGDIPTEANYSGKIESVAIGFFGHVGIGLPAGDTCHGQPIIVLLTTHPQYKEILSTLLAAQTSGQEVNIHRLGLETSSFGVGYCVVQYLSLGDFIVW